MRSTFIRTLTELAVEEEDIALVTADMGFSVFEDFAQRYPGRFYNVGIAEATMIGFAAGLAMQGLRPFVYSISPFATMRCFEQIRVDVCYQNLPVTVVGVGGGLSYGALASTHHSIEDIAIMRALPNMSVFTPADPLEAEACVRTVFESRGPAYIRLARNNDPRLHRRYPVVNDGPLPLVPGREVAIIASGTIVGQAIQASQMLRESEHVQMAVYSMPVIKPLNVKAIVSLAHQYDKLVLLEEHSVVGGVSSAVIEALVDAQVSSTAQILRLGIPDAYPTEYGSHDFLLRYFDLDAQAISGRVLEWLNSSS